MNHVEVAPDELAGQVTALVEITAKTSELVESARELARRYPKLGTAPPAVDLAKRLRAAAGDSGLTGEIAAADRELDSFHRALRETVTEYQDGERDIAWRLTTTDEPKA